jgi:hypothetical protein
MCVQNASESCNHLAPRKPSRLLVVPILLTIGFAFAFVFALLWGFSALEPFLRARRLHRGPFSAVATVAKGTDVTVQGTVVGVKRAAPYPRLTEGAVAFSELQVIEQVGKQTRVALRSRNAQLFSVRDDRDAVIDVDPEGAELIDGRVVSLRASQAPPGVLEYVNRTGSFAWQNTPATCHEEALLVGDRVTVRGRVILPLPGQTREGDTELRVTAKQLAVALENPWKSPSGRSLSRALLVAGASLPAALACAAWAGLF